MAEVHEDRSVSIKELSETRTVVVREEAGPTRRSNTQPVVVADGRERQTTVITESISSRPCSSNREEWLISILTNECEQEPIQSPSKPRIQKVPMKLREIKSNTTCYDPMVASIGPYHYGKPELDLAQKLKTTTARQFISSSDKPISVFYNKVAEVACKARQCYAEGSTAEFSDEEFTRMIFLDGCFILHFIDCVVNNKRDDMKMKNHHLAFLLRDLLLLENQLPFIVLEALMSLKFHGDAGKEMVIKFIKQQNTDAGPWCLKAYQPLHLLDLLREELIGKLPEKSSSSPKEGGWHSFRSVKELEAVGIKFKRSHTCSLKDVHFRSFKVYGHLSLPRIAIDDSTKSKFLNLIAYELCPDAPVDYSVTSFVCFLDSLIDRADDVKELRSEGILLNSLGNDEQVADLFNELTMDLVPDPAAYLKVKSRIEKHCKNWWRIWMTEALHTHFRSPWTVVGFLAATLLIILTSIQTMLTIFPPNKN